MPLVYACICPPGSPPEGSRTAAALARVAEELPAFEPDTVVLVYARSQSLSVLTSKEVVIDCAEDPLVRETDRQLADRITAAHVGRPLELRHQDESSRALSVLCGLREGIGGARLLAIAGWIRSLRACFDLGRAAGPAIASYQGRVAMVCTASLSTSSDAGGRAFDRQYQRTIDNWDVKWVVGADQQFRSRTGEHALAQTAVLMGALSAYRIQPRVLSYEASSAGGELVATIDVLGRRMRERAAAGGRTEAEAR